MKITDGQIIRILELKVGRKLVENSLKIIVLMSKEPKISKRERSQKPWR